MEERFDYFVVFADMRTGSNFLEANLNAFESFHCHGEAFNPYFIGYPNKTELLGISQPMREADPLHLIRTIRASGPGLGGFRFFHDHDPRALAICLDDPRCAKIVLTRNPAESYVSWKIAQATGQWKLTNVKRRRDSRIRFDAAEFETHVASLLGFQERILHRLQVTGQTAFYLAYEDLQDVAVMNGLAAFLGSEERLEKLDGSLKKQNPAPLSEKVTNFREMERALAGFDRFNLSRTPNFEPRRGAAVPGFVTGARAPLLFMPVRGGPEAEVTAWLAALDGVAPDTLPTQMSQKELRQWMRARPGHRSFAVLRHPVARAHAVFCARILDDGPGAFTRIRATLRNVHKLPIPEGAPGPDHDPAAHRAAFVAFLEFLRANLAGQTGIRVDPHWASQAAMLQGMAQFAIPDRVIREDEMSGALPELARAAGLAEAPAAPPAPPDSPVALDEIYDDEIERVAARVYQRDYVLFGFGPWG